MANRSAQLSITVNETIQPALTEAARIWPALSESARGQQIIWEWHRNRTEGDTKSRRLDELTAEVAALRKEIESLKEHQAETNRILLSLLAK